jgi:hypothetical protein
MPPQHSSESWTLCDSTYRRFQQLGTFIESGSYHGGGIAQALKHNFQKIISIEKERNLYEKC